MTMFGYKICSVWFKNKTLGPVSKPVYKWGIYFKTYKNVYRKKHSVWIYFLYYVLIIDINKKKQNNY